MNNQYAALLGRRIGIYTGFGTSHSWLWFADVFEKMGFDNLIFMEEDSLKQWDFIEQIDVLLISGGDTFSIAEGMSEEGTDNIKRFITDGGVYFGSCAGAYLPLNSSKYPLNLLNLVSVKISNLSKAHLPSRDESEKFCTPYGCQYVIHPVRDEVKLRLVNGFSSRRNGEINAPLYGGPCMDVSDNVVPLAFYYGFTNKTLFMVDEDVAKEMVLGKMAVCSKVLGEGKLYLSGPHLEHPYYPEANQLLVKMLCDGLRKKPAHYRCHDETHVRRGMTRDLVETLKKELSGARIIALSMEHESLSWLIGKKVYEPEKFRVFIEALWNRFGLLERHALDDIAEEDVQSLISGAKEARVNLKRLKTEVHTTSDTTELVEQILTTLRGLASSFMNVYFRLKRYKWEEMSNVHVL